jgi:hypothetical protein
MVQSPWEARKTLASAVASYDWSAAKADNHDRWIIHVLRREAESLILPMKQLDDAKPADRAGLQKQLPHWRDDPDLAGLCEPATLDKLPPAERQECRALWSDLNARLGPAHVSNRATVPASGNLHP